MGVLAQPLKSDQLGSRMLCLTFSFLIDEVVWGLILYHQMAERVK